MKSVKLRTNYFHYCIDYFNQITYSVPVIDKTKYPSDCMTPEQKAFYNALKDCYGRLKQQVFEQELSNKGLVFIYGNDKLKDVYTFSLPAGWTCPGASACLSKADPIKGGVKDGPNCQFRCFAASEESRLTVVRKIRWHNFNLLNQCKTIWETAHLITDSLPKNAKVVRIHVSGDFFNEIYFQAWLDVAMAFPNIIFYAYTKSIPMLIKYRNSLPSNFRITASMGSKFDDLIISNNLNRSVVVKDEAEAKALGLEIDDDDSHAIAGDASFALLVHASQPAGTVWAKAWEAIRQTTVQANKAAPQKAVRPPVTVFQLVCRIMKMVSRLIAAGGKLSQVDADLVGTLTINAAGVPLPS